MATKNTNLTLEEALAANPKAGPRPISMATVTNRKVQSAEKPDPTEVPKTTVVSLREYNIMSRIKKSLTQQQKNRLRKGKKQKAKMLLSLYKMELDRDEPPSWDDSVIIARKIEEIQNFLNGDCNTTNLSL